MAEATHTVTTSRFIIAIAIAWMLFIGVDFLFHASLFASLWKEKIAAIKSLDNLAILIPAGYGSFLLLTVLIGYVYKRIFPVRPALHETLQFGFVFGLLYSLSNLLGVFSYVAIPLKHLIFFNIVYFLEILVVTISLHTTLFTTHLKRTFWRSLLVFFTLLIIGIVIQNVF